MTPHVNISLFLCLLGILSLPILTLSVTERWPMGMEMKWIVSFLWVLLKQKISTVLDDWFEHIKRVVTMDLPEISPPANVIPADRWSKMPIIDRYQHFMRRRFQEMENVYYAQMDELEQKLEDLGEIHPDHIPNFTLHHFVFLKEWQYGDVSTQYVLGLLKGMNLQDVAEKTICRRLRNFGYGKEKLDSYEYIKAVHDNLFVKCVPLYLKYLEMLVKYFVKMDEIDHKQIRLAWIEQIWSQNGEISKRCREVSLNQIYREIDNNIIPRNDHKYTVGENIIVFDEDMSDDALACHWILGPKSYIKLLKDQFKVTETMDLAEEKAYIKKMIGTFLS